MAKVTAPAKKAATPPKVKTTHPQVDPPQVDPPQVDPPQVDPPQVDPPQVDPPQVDPPQVDPPQVDPPQGENATILEMMSRYAQAYPGEKTFHVTTDLQVFLNANKAEALAHQKIVDVTQEIFSYDIT